MTGFVNPDRGLALARKAMAQAGDAALGLGAGLRDRVLGGGKSRRVAHVMTVARSPEEVYGLWRDLAGLPRFLGHLERVDVLDNRRSHWVARAPGGTTVEWDAEITEDVPGSVLAWRSVAGTNVPNEGRVTFSPAASDRGTEVRVVTAYRPPFGAAGVAVARAAGEEPDQQTREDLRRFKAVAECGEYVRLEGQPTARNRLQEAVTRLVGQRAREEGRS